MISNGIQLFLNILIAQLDLKLIAQKSQLLYVLDQAGFPLKSMIQVYQEPFVVFLSKYPKLESINELQVIKTISKGPVQEIVLDYKDITAKPKFKYILEQIEANKRIASSKDLSKIYLSLSSTGVNQRRQSIGDQSTVGGDYIDEMLASSGGVNQSLLYSQKRFSSLESGNISSRLPTISKNSPRERGLAQLRALDVVRTHREKPSDVDFNFVKVKGSPKGNQGENVEGVQKGSMNLDQNYEEYKFEVKLQKLRNDDSFQKSMANDIEQNKKNLRDQLEKAEEEINSWEGIKIKSNEVIQQKKLEDIHKKIQSFRKSNFDNQYDYATKDLYSTKELRSVLSQQINKHLTQKIKERQQNRKAFRVPEGKLPVIDVEKVIKTQKTDSPMKSIERQPKQVTKGKLTFIIKDQPYRQKSQTSRIVDTINDRVQSKMISTLDCDDMFDEGKIEDEKLKKKRKVVSQFDMKRRLILNNHQRNYNDFIKKNSIKQTTRADAIEALVNQNYPLLSEQNLIELEEETGFCRRDLINLYTQFLSIFRIQNYRKDYILDQKPKELKGLDFDVFQDNIPLIKYDNREIAQNLFKQIEDDLKGKQMSLQDFLRFLKAVLAQSFSAKIDTFFSQYQKGKSTTLDFKAVNNICLNCLQSLFDSKDLFVKETADFFAQFIYDKVGADKSEEVEVEKIKDIIKNSKGEDRDILALEWRKKLELETSIEDRNNQSYRFVENNLTRSIGDIKSLNDSRNESYNLYEPGTSDPNQIKPKEFKQQLGGVPLDPQDSAIKKLQALTSNSYNNKKPISQVVDQKRSSSHLSGKRRSLAAIAEQNLKTGSNVQIIGQSGNVVIKKKRKRFNEQLEDNMSKKSGASVNQTSLSLAAKPKQNSNLTGAALSSIQKLPQLTKVKDEELLSQISKASSKLRSTASVKQVLNQAPGVQKPIDTQSSAQKQSYKDKIIDLINELDDQQLEQLGEELNMKDEEEQKKESESKSGLNAQDLAALEKQNDKKTEESKQLKDEPQVSEMRSVITEQKSQISKRTSSTVISKLQKQLEEEKKAREQMKQEIDELKKMNHELCNAILSTNSQISKQDAKK